MNSAYIEYNGKVCIQATTLWEHNIATSDQWKKWCFKAKSQNYITRPGGNGRSALIELLAIPTNYRETIVSKFGNPAQQFNALEEYFVMDSNARQYYDQYRHAVTGKALEPYQVSRYTTNASVLIALYKLREARSFLTKRMGNPKRDLKPGLAADSIAFNEVLKNKYNGLQHSLPKHPRKLSEKITEFMAGGSPNFETLIDGRAQNQNAQVVTPEMIDLWNAMFAGQRHKPTHYEVSHKYQVFLLGKLEIVNPETGELYDPKAECYKPVSDRSVFNYLSEWKNRTGVFKARSGNRKTYMDKFTPSARMLRPSVGAIISVDDFQPPFKWAKGGGNRMWFYAAQDLGSTAITTWVYGDSKEGIITDFYRQLLRNYESWGIKLPYELECEASLNSSFVNTFLANGVMFQKVRVIRNKPRSKRIERTLRDLRLTMARKHPAFVARPDAVDENYQSKAGEQIYISKEEIIEFELRCIEIWNNEEHPDQDIYPKMSRWDVFLKHQNANLKPTNYVGALPHLGNYTRTSMNMGRVRLQGIDRVAGVNGAVALGENLLRIMNEIEGQEVDVYYLDNLDGQVVKSLVFNTAGRFICELLDDLPFHRSELDQTDRCRKNMELYFAYENTVESHAKRIAKTVKKVELVETETHTGSFVMPGLKRYETPETDTEILPDLNPVEMDVVPVKQKDFFDRF